jgi:hypothetical protein
MRNIPHLVLGLAAVAIAGFSAAAADPEVDPPTDPLAEDTLVTFSVNMTGATRLDGTPFEPGFEGVWVNGNFANWWAWGNAPTAYQLADDGTNGDETPGDLTYSIQVLLASGSGRMLEYKYAIDSFDNEAGPEDNRVRYVREDGAFVLPGDVFGQMTKETPDGGPGGEIGTLAIGKGANGDVILTWNGSAGVRVQKTPSLVTPAWQEVAGTAGASTVTVPASDDSGFFRLYRP